MQVAASIDPTLPLSEVATHARRVEALGYDVLHVAETINDPFAVALLALEHTSTLIVRTSVALAFPRSPMVVAYSAWGLARFAPGRFQLGLGSQIRANIEGRYSVEWSDPVGRMREYMESLRAIFASFGSMASLHFEGDHYRFTRLQPYFNPGPEGLEPPQLWLGGVNEKMCRLAGEVADGFVSHPTNSTTQYLESICLPNIRKGAADRGRDAADVAVVAGFPVVTGSTAEDLAHRLEDQRRTLAFLYSTPAYRPTLELFGWGELGERLRELTREGRWEELPKLVGDEILDVLVVKASYEELPAEIERRYKGLVSGVLIPAPSDAAEDPEHSEALRAIKALASDGSSDLRGAGH